MISLWFCLDAHGREEGRWEEYVVLRYVRKAGWSGRWGLVGVMQRLMDVKEKVIRIAIPVTLQAAVTMGASCENLEACKINVSATRLNHKRFEIACRTLAITMHVTLPITPFCKSTIILLNYSSP